MEFRTGRKIPDRFKRFNDPIQVAQVFLEVLTQIQPTRCRAAFSDRVKFQFIFVSLCYKRGENQFLFMVAIGDVFLGGNRIGIGPIRGDISFVGSEACTKLVAIFVLEALVLLEVFRISRNEIDPFGGCIGTRKAEPSGLRHGAAGSVPLFFEMVGEQFH